MLVESGMKCPCVFDDWPSSISAFVSWQLTSKGCDGQDAGFFYWSAQGPVAFHGRLPDCPSCKGALSSALS